ncbi:MAG TPA: HEAT repeat domain-containing protein [Bryobacteraceae bacterium]|nr:HEAT repeat domain-containing protein [Bryobacteraceae bacterium]
MGAATISAQDPESRMDRARERLESALAIAQDRAARARDDVDRARDAADRLRDLYQRGQSALDNRQYDRAIESFDRVIEAKASNVDGAYYWKAYALNKLGRRDEALAALAEIPKQFPQSRWIHDAKALGVEVRQAAGQNVSPESQADEDLKLLAINVLMNSDPQRAMPMLEKVINDPKNSPGLKKRALYVLAMNRSDKARDIVAHYAKGGSNPDLQLRAVEYLGMFRTQASRQTLAGIYAATGDVNVKLSVLRSFMFSRDPADLFNAATSETNPDLRREAIHQLGILQAVNELGRLYSAEPSYEVKDAILHALFIAQAAGKLADIAKSENDARLRASAIRQLGNVRADKAADTLTAMYIGEPDKTVKTEIIQALWRQGAAQQLVAVIRAEKDPELTKEGVRRLGMMKSKEATDYLMELINK